MEGGTRPSSFRVSGTRCGRSRCRWDGDPSRDRPGSSSCAGLDTFDDKSSRIVAAVAIRAGRVVARSPSSLPAGWTGVDVRGRSTHLLLPKHVRYGVGGAVARRCDWCQAVLIGRPDMRFCNPSHKSRWHHAQRRERERAFLDRLASADTNSITELRSLVREAERLIRRAA